MIKGVWPGRIERLLWIGVVFPLLTGCWDRLEIEERAVVLAIGIDEVENGSEVEVPQITNESDIFAPPNNQLVRVTVQIAVPGGIPLGPGEGGGGSSGVGSGQRSIWVVDAVGHTIEGALNNLQQRIAPPLFYGHLRIIIVSEAVARKGIDNLNDYFRRNPEVRRMNWMFVCKGKAIDLMKTSPQLERVPPLYLVSMMDQAVKMGRFPNDFLGLFWSASSALGKEGFLPYLSLKPQGTMEIDGMAFFVKDKMVGLTKPIEIPMYMGIMGMSPAGGQVYVQVPEMHNFVLFGGRARKSIIKSSIRDGEPHISIHTGIEGVILEKFSEGMPLDDRTIHLIERKLEHDALEGYRELIRKTQEKGSDIFGFGEIIRAKQWRYWNRHIGTEEAWREKYKTLDVDINVHIYIRRIGMKSR
jgi:spore germination protein KC